MKTAIHFGAGNIGRGFIGMLLAQANYKVIFADVQEDIVNALAQKKQYEVQVVGDKRQTILVENVSALNSNDPQLVDAIAQAEIITTATGPNVLKFLAPTIAKGLQKAQEQNRDKSLNIIACENAVRATTELKKHIKAHMPNLPIWAGFVDAAVDRIVPPAENKEDILKVHVEDFYEWLTEKQAFVGEIPNIHGMTLVNNLEAGVERKLFTLNTGHAVCAWIGQYLGFSTIGQAIANERVKEIVYNVMWQSGNALIAKHKFKKEAHEQYIKKIFKRFENPYIIDDVERVGRQPVRKLSKGERIARPIQTALAYDLPVDKLFLGAAIAMYFKNDNDPQVKELKQMVTKNGATATFSILSGLDVPASFEKIYNNLSQYL